jgi:hypothetical protein
LVEINGNDQGGCVGGVGGFLGQVAVCFSAVWRRWKKDVDLLNPKVVQNFLFLYLTSKMRTEKIVL